MTTKTRKTDNSLRATIIAAGLAKFIVGAFALSFSPLLPEIGKSLNIPSQWLGFAGGSYGLSSAIMALISSRIQDKFPREKLIVLGTIIHLGGILLVGFAQVFSILLMGKLICGIGAGLLLPALVAYISDRTPYEKRATILSKSNIGWAASTLVGVPILAFVGEYFGWRAAQFSLGILWPITILLLFYGTKTLKLATGETSAPIGIASKGKFSEILPMFITTFLFFIGFYGVYSFIGVSMAKNHSTPHITGLIIFFYGLGFLTATTYSKFIDKIGKERVFFFSLLVLATLLFFISFTVGLNLIIVGGLMFLWGNAQNLAFTSSTSIVSGVPEGIRGKALAFNQSALSFGASTGTAVMGFVIANYSFLTAGVCCSVLTLSAATITKFKINK